MSGLGHQQTLRHPQALSALPPKADTSRTSRVCPLCANSNRTQRSKKSLLNHHHLVGAGEQRRRHVKRDSPNGRYGILDRGTAASVRLDVGRPNYLAPLLGFFGYELAEVG